MSWFRSKKSTWLVGLVVALLMVSLIVSVAGCKKNPVQGKVLRVAFSSAPDAIDVVGYKIVEILKEAGIQAEAKFFDGGSKAVQAILAGQADISSNSLEDTINAGLMAFALSRPKNMYTMVGKPGMTSVEDIRGKVLGAADPGSIANIIAEAIFEKHGIDRNSVGWVQIGGGGSRTSALLSGRVDAVFVYGGNYLKLVEAGFSTLTTMGEEFPGLHDDMWVAPKDWLDANEALAVEVCKAQILAARWFHEKPDEWLAMALERVEGLERSTALALYEVLLDMDFYPVDGLMTQATLQATADFLIGAGEVPDVPVENWATMKYMNEARRVLGVQVSSGN